MPGKHAPDSPRSFYVSVGKALGAALGSVGLIVVAVVLLLGRGDDTKQTGSPAIQGSSPAATRSPSPTPSASSPTPKPSPSILPKGQTIVDVFNGTTRQGEARAFGKKLVEAGYRFGHVGNASSKFAKSTLYYLPGRRAEALAFQEEFPEFTVLRELRFTGGATLRAIIGSDYP
jgi:LytR cell envelope-related transcriptional attenuator